ncbi:hypothetical protein [Avibacterium sp. 21-594]|uniref:hypothetical protein n=1 Tax=Avibacterium sp. 21-594 TaxID=2911535 RepID=UPI002245F05C|nr:hypothetical protein [Avibacterium sp. 21-594]MCW9715091.1 hypothetical protein [Avibacterium sp. 21-594]
MQHSFTLIHWYGPFELSEVIESDWGKGKGLYIATGKTKGSRKDSSVQYCGITDRSYANRFKEHEILPEINRELQIWLGEVVVSPYPSRNSAKLKEPERLITYYLDFDIDLLNTKNLLATPEVGTLVNYWFKKDKTLRSRKPREIKALPDVISWDGEELHFGQLKIKDYEE